MPNPTVTDVHVESALSNVSIAYQNEEYIADRVFPMVGVSKKSDYYFIFGRQAWFREHTQVRAPGTRAARVDYQVTTASYNCINYAHAIGVPDEVRKNADEPLRPSIEAVEFIADALDRSREKRVADIVMNSSNWAYSASPTTQWSSDTSEPIDDIETAIQNVVLQIGRLPNTMVMSYEVFKNLKVHPDILDRIKFTRPGAIFTETDLSAWVGIPNILVGRSVYDPAQEGASASQTFIWGDDLWIGYVAPTPALMTPTAGMVFRWTEGGGRMVNQFREDQEHQDVFEAMEYTDEIISASEAGGILYDVV